MIIPHEGGDQVATATDLFMKWLTLQNYDQKQAIRLQSLFAGLEKFPLFLTASRS
jgi:hypothetical protein